MAFLSRGKTLKIKKVETCRKRKYGRKRVGVDLRRAKKHFQTKPENIGNKKTKNNQPNKKTLTNERKKMDQESDF